jgi:hypothetical protein
MEIKNRLKKKETIIGIIIFTAAIGLLIGLSVGIPLSQSKDNLKKANNILDKYILLDG